MEIHGQILCVFIVIAIIAATWIGPRSWGLLGLLAAHFFCVFGWLSMAMVSLYTGIWSDYESRLVLIGLLFQAFIVNLFLLPLGIYAMRRWQRLSINSSKLSRVRCAYRNTRFQWYAQRTLHTIS